MINGAILIMLVAVGVIFGKLLQINNRQETTLFMLERNLEAMNDFIQRSQTTEENTIRALKEICEALNKFFETSTGYINDSFYGIQNIAASMVPFISGVQKQAIDNDNFETAQECAKLIKNLKRIAEHKD